MTSRNRFFRPNKLRRFNTLFLLILSPLIGAGQTFQAYESSISIQGTARENPWEMTAPKADCSIVLTLREGRIVNASSLNFILQVRDLKSDYAKMDNRAYKALKSYPHDKIRFTGKKNTTISEIGSNSYMLTAEGNLSIAGITQVALIRVNITVNADGSLTCQGNHKILRSSFKVTLPADEERIMRISDEVLMRFDIRLKKSTV